MVSLAKYTIHGSYGKEAMEILRIFVTLGHPGEYLLRFGV